MRGGRGTQGKVKAEQPRHSADTFHGNMIQACYLARYQKGFIMAASWMKAKTLKLKRDGMADSRGPFARFSENPSKSNPRSTRAPGWYATGKDKRSTCGTYRGAPRSMGPFASQTEARRFARAMFDDASIKTFEV